MFIQRDRILAGLIVCLVLVTINLPYIYAWKNAGPDYQFTGFLLNPQDGNSYLAKMYEGWRGDLQFTLPYTADKGNGAFLFLFYLWLGYLTRLLGIPLVVMFHVARVISGLIMYLCLYRFLAHTFEQVHVRLFAFILAIIGSGMGWIALVFGKFTSDFWVAEAYPYLSVFSNPHFPLGLAVILLLFTFTRGRYSGLPNWLAGLLSLSLAIIMPFGVVLALVILAGVLLWELFPSYRHLFRSITFQRLAWIGLGGLPVLAYDFLVTYQDPLLRAWNSQNQTPSPPLWDLFVALCPVIILALIGLWMNKASQERSIRLLITWMILGFVLLYIPWGLQRRFILGYYIPISALAVAGLGALVKRPRGYALAAILIMILAIPTNLVIGLSTLHASSTHDARIYLSQGEAEALQWISTNTPSDAVILAAPDTGLFIPAYTGRRVLYGHPYETVDAVHEKEKVTRFFSGKSTALERSDLLAEVDYLFIGPREAQLGNVTPPPDTDLSYAKKGVRIFQVAKH
jgi:hypothetical protein